MEEVKSRRHTMTDEEVEVRIAELKADPDVRLAWKEKTVKYKRRRYLGALQSDKRRGCTASGGRYHMGDAGRTGRAAERARLPHLMMTLWQGSKPPGSQPGKVVGANHRRS